MIPKRSSFLACFTLFNRVCAVTIDPDYPNNADPTPFPTSGNYPYTRSPDPWPTGIPTLPDFCDMYNPSDECFNALDAHAAENNNKGAYLYLDKNNGCSPEQQDKLKVGWWEAQDILGYTRNWPNAGSGTRGRVAGEYWMGPDWPNFQDRIAGNLARASDFINDPANKKNYITITCADPKALCQKRRQRMNIGGYAWNKDWTYWTYGYVNMCDSYYTLSSISEKEDEINGYLQRGEIDKVRDMSYYQTYGQLLSHEMFHLRSTWYPEPPIYDQFVEDIPWDSPLINPLEPRAYGSRWVHRLARKRPTDQGGAIKSSQNADSYAILASNIYWWDVNGIFPGVPSKPSAATDDGPPVMYLPSIYLNNDTTVSTTDFSSQFDSVLDSYAANNNDPEDGHDPSLPSGPSSPTATPGTSVKPGTELRILPLGDSITWGYRSSDGNGYRLELFNDLSADKVVYAGTQPNGNMEDNLNEGYPGKTIQYIHNHMSAALSEGPNIVLLMAGTNDLNPDPKISTEGSDPTQALARLGDLIDQVSKTLNNAVILVAQLPGVNDNQQHADNTASFNEQLVPFVQKRVDSGSKLALVDMRPVQGSAIYANDVHPTDQGYRNMGHIWYNAILQIPKDEIVTPSSLQPVAPQASPDSGAESPGTCPYPSPKFRAPDYCTTTPIYDNDGVVGDGGGLGPNLFGPIKCVSTPGDGRPICRCTKHDDINAPDGNPSTSWDAAYADEIGGDCSGLDLPWTTAVRLADMDGDGDLDYLFVRNDSSVLGFENIGSSDQAHVGYHYHQRIAKGVIGHEGVTYDFRHEIQFADLNNDGLADYIWTHPNGRVEAWFQANTGWCNLDNNGFIYQGQIADGIGKPGYGVRHVDLNGDGRADYVYVGPDGTTIAWRNVHDPNYPGGIRYVNDGEIHGPTSVPGSKVQFADITGKGTPDYLMVESDGRTTMDFNGGPIHNDNTCNRYFQSHGVIATGAGPDYGVLYGDLDGDGRAEYTTIDPKNSAIHAYYARCPDRENRLWCRDSPNTANRDLAISAAQGFCSVNAGKIVGYDSRLEEVGKHASLTAICTSCQPNDEFSGILDEDLCNESMARIINDCVDASGSVTSDPIEYIYLQY